MLYFTKEWCTGKVSDEEWEGSRNAYNAYIDSIFADLPFALKLLTKFISLHDGKVITSYIDEDVQTLQISAGDLQLGYFDLSLEYVKAKGGKVPQEGEILYTELQKISSGYTHTFLLADFTTFEITFETLNLSILSKT